ncbi:MAG TPA: hypothetical protein VI522_04025 [Gammaproteobacteria bacterium]|nr:hypothetical protein [Gammaproteobacteria bacterium]
MKLITCFHILPFTFFCLPAVATQNPYEIIIKPLWQPIDTAAHYRSFESSWVLAGSITFRNRSNTTLMLDALDIALVHDTGEKIDHITAMLFKEKGYKKFLPTDDFLVSDGVWSKKKQTVSFTFNHHEHLASYTTFYLALTIPQHLHPLLARSHFVITSRSLPTPYQKTVAPQSLHLAYVPTMHAHVA